MVVGVNALFLTTLIVDNFNETFKARLNLDAKLVRNIAPLMMKKGSYCISKCFELAFCKITGI